MYLDLDFLTVLFGILNRGLEMCCVCRTDITVLQHCLWHLIEGESWAPRDNLLQLGRKGGLKRLVFTSNGVGVEIRRIRLDNLEKLHPDATYNQVEKL